MLLRHAKSAWDTDAPTDFDRPLAKRGRKAAKRMAQWVAANEKTGMLELERNKIRKQIYFRSGRIVGCSSDDPSTRIGQFLISRGKISERTLQYALEQQKQNGRGVTDILVEMGRMKSVGGQEDLIEDVAIRLARPPGG